jgi:hypothetical protein
MSCASPPDLLVEPHDNCSVGKPTIQDSTAELQPPSTKLLEALNYSKPCRRRHFPQ